MTVTLMLPCVKGPVSKRDLCFPETWIMVARFKITDSLSLRLIKLVYCKVAASGKDIYDKNCKPFTPPSPIPSIMEILTGITCKKIHCYMRDWTCTWFIVKRVKRFWSYVKHFWILAGVRKCRILIRLCN